MSEHPAAATADPLHFPWPVPPASGQALPLDDDWLWVRMPLPFALDHINLWLRRDRIDGRDGWTLIDTGIGHETTKSAWASLFPTAMEGLPLLRLLVTHMHPDHIGLADWLTQRFDCLMSISLSDLLAARLAVQAATGFGGEAVAQFYASHGVTDDRALALVRRRVGYYASMVPSVPSRHRRLIGGQTLTIGGETARCIVGHGHAPEHIAFELPDRGWLVSGDMVLPRISTNVMVMEQEPDADPLGLYLDALTAYESLPADTLVLPSHGLPFRGLHARIAQLRAHHDDRLADTLAACRESPKTAMQVMPLLFRRALDTHQLNFALGESIAHLHWLWHRRQLQRAIDAQGVIRFSAA